MAPRGAGCGHAVVRTLQEKRKEDVTNTRRCDNGEARVTGFTKLFTHDASNYNNVTYVLQEHASEADTELSMCGILLSFLFL